MNNLTPNAHHETIPTTTIDRMLSDASATAEFIHTDTAAALLYAFDQAELTISPALEAELKNEHTIRYGGPYAWMSRNLAQAIMGVHDNYRGKYGLFTVNETWSDAQDDWVTEPLDLMALDLTGDLAADVMIDQLRQLHLRDVMSEGQSLSDIPVTSQPKQFKHLGCKDVEEYFSQALTLGKISPVAINSKQFWHKQHGGATYLNREQVEYCGIELPPGCVFRRDNDGYTMLRMTGFMFDKVTADAVFGKGMTYIYGLEGSEDQMVRAFDAFAL